MVALIAVADDPPRAARPHPIRDIASSFALWRRYPALVAIAACVVISNVGNMAVRTALLLVAYRVFALGPDGAGWILAIGGLASVVGATQAGRVSARLGIGPSLALATTVEGLAWAIAPLGLVAAPLAVLAAAALVSGLATPVWNVNVVTLRQRIVARRGDLARLRDGGHRARRVRRRRRRHRARGVTRRPRRSAHGDDRRCDGGWCVRDPAPRGRRRIAA